MQQVVSVLAFSDSRVARSMMGSSCSSAATSASEGDRPKEAEAGLPIAERDLARIEGTVQVSEVLGDVVSVSSEVISAATSVLEPLESILGPVSTGLSIIGGILEFIQRVATNNLMCIEIQKRALSLSELAKCMIYFLK